MKKQLTDFIISYVEAYQARDGIVTRYGTPLVGFADAHHPYIQSLTQLIGPTHDLPQNVLPDARTIIAYYLPFTRELASTNRPDAHLASPEWARAYEETNALFAELNDQLIAFIHTKAGLASVSPGAATFDQQKLVSDWSHRHIAYAAGLGTFGLNNMLLTERGCCGRFSTVITNLDLTPDLPQKKELCLFRRKGSCGICARNCPVNALTPEGFDRRRCYELCRENAAVYTDFGSSYTNEDGTGPNSVGSDVCGKCVTASPCAFHKL